MYKTPFQVNIYYQLMPTPFERFLHSIRRKTASRENGGETEISVLIPNCENNNFVGMAIVVTPTPTTNERLAVIDHQLTYP